MLKAAFLKNAGFFFKLPFSVHDGWGCFCSKIISAKSLIIESNYNSNFVAVFFPTRCHLKKFRPRRRVYHHY